MVEMTFAEVFVSALRLFVIQTAISWSTRYYCTRKVRQTPTFNPSTDMLKYE